jgi:hypothetical protein
MQQSKPQRRRLLKFWGVLPTKGGVEVEVEVRKGGASSALPFPLRGPIPSALQVFGRPEGRHCYQQALAELVVTRAGCWLLGKPGEGGHLGPRRRALCALPRPPPVGGCWVLAVMHLIRRVGLCI